MSSPLIVGPDERRNLQELRERASKKPVNMVGLAERLLIPANKDAHMDQMADQTIGLPTAFLVTYSVEFGHPIGPCRHMSLSSVRRGAFPIPQAVWMVAEELGFVGSLKFCTVWPEELMRGSERAVAINVLQPVALIPPSGELPT